mmetsp:Transcript_112586/g.314581  ORF Transcript_112586/g.314581 Transcript_112586/m.314581 type:complete len:202 (+) Transcript_112586:74-679(+)
MLTGNLDSESMMTAGSDASDAASVVSSVSSLSSAQVSITSFVRVLVRGRPVTLVKELPHDPFIDRRLALLRLKKDMSSIAIRGDDLFIGMALTDIVDVFTVEAGDCEHIPQGIVERLGPSELESLLHVVHRIPDGTLMAFCMLEARPKFRTLLIQTLRALVKRARKGGGRAADASQAVAQPSEDPAERRFFRTRGSTTTWG